MESINTLSEPLATEIISQRLWRRGKRAVALGLFCAVVGVLLTLAAVLSDTHGAVAGKPKPAREVPGHLDALRREQAKLTQELGDRITILDRKADRIEALLRDVSQTTQAGFWPFVATFLIGFGTSLISVIFYESARSPKIDIVLGEATPSAGRRRFLQARVWNRPLPRYLRGIRRLPAGMCRAWVTISGPEEGGERREVTFNGRWVTRREPGEYLPEGRLRPDPGQILVVPREDIPSNEYADLAVAFKYAGEERCYGFNNENYLQPEFRLQDREFVQGRYTVTVRVLAGGIDCTKVFELRNEGTELGNFELFNRMR